jgi:hypothetical protein
MTVSSERNDGLMQLAGFAIAHAVWCVRDDQVLLPMMLIDVNGERQVLRFKAERLDQGVEEGRRRLVANPDQAQRAILVYDAFVTTDDGRCDALIGEARDYNADAAVVRIYQRYRPAGSAAGFGVYSPKLEFPADSVVDQQAAAEAFLQGLVSHQQGGQVWDEFFIVE